MNKHMRTLTKLAKKFDRVIETRKCGHLMIIDPTGARNTVYVSKTPSCPFVMRKITADLQRAEL